MSTRLHLVVAAALPLSLCQITTNGQCDTLDFEGFPSETAFTDQYQSCGVVFSSNGLPTPPVTYDYGSTSWTSVLHSYDWYGELRMDFVDPLDGVTPAPVSYVSFDNPIDSEIDYIVGNAYDVNGVVLATINSASPDLVVVNSGSSNIAYIILDDAQTSAYVIDHLVFSGEGSSTVPELTNTPIGITPTLAEEAINVNVGTSQNTELVLIAADGRVVHRSLTSSASTVVSVSHLASGTYTVCCTAGGTLRTARFVKM